MWGKKKCSGSALKPPGPTEKNEKKVETVLFVPQTPGGVLADMLRQAERQMADILGDTIKIVEKSGVTLRRVLHKSNPWAGVNCGRGDCLPCRSGDVKDCTRRNILYETACLQCKENGKEIYM